MEWDYVVVGSGFGGSVSGLRLVEKGYRVLMLEQGARLEAGDFPRSNWNLKRWMWMPRFGCRGLFQMTFLKHVTVLSGVGVGGGSLVYANTLPKPKPEFFANESWAGLADWEEELEPHYETAYRMLGATENPVETPADRVLGEVANDLGVGDAHHPTKVSVYFGEPGVTVPDPYFGGEGPERTGCIGCGGCMLGCRYGAKNTLDKNYLHLAEARGLVVKSDSRVTFVSPLAGGGYRVSVVEGRGLRRRERSYETGAVVFSAGVLGTVELLLKLKQAERGLPALSDRLGDRVRTNSEVLMAVVSQKRDVDYSTGVAISSIVHTDPHSHVEPVRYPSGSGFFRLLMAPHAPGESGWVRLARAAGTLLRHPIRSLRAALVPDFARYSIILLYMRTLEGYIRLRLGRRFGLFRRVLKSVPGDGPLPTAAIPEATDIGRRVAEKIDGFPVSMITETALGIPTTAHILGGCAMGESAADGVIDHRHRLFGYDRLYVVDGSAISANPGVNPSLTICALAERAMSFVPPKADAGSD